MPLSINTQTRELSITTSEGQKIITVLPEQAIQNLINSGFINEIDKSTTSIKNSEEFASFNGIIKLENRNNKLVYKVNGKKNHKLFGFIPISAPITVFISTETGEPLSKQQSVITNIVDFLST